METMGCAEKVDSVKRCVRYTLMHIVIDVCIVLVCPIYLHVHHTLTHWLYFNCPVIHTHKKECAHTHGLLQTSDKNRES